MVGAGVVGVGEVGVGVARVGEVGVEVAGWGEVGEVEKRRPQHPRKFGHPGQLCHYTVEGG